MRITKILSIAAVCFVLKASYTQGSNWAAVYGGSQDERPTNALETPDGGVLIGVDTYSFGYGGSDDMLIKLDVDGDIEWSKTYGGSGDDDLHALTMQNVSSGGYIFGGKTNSFGVGGYDGHIVRVADDGTVIWEKTYGTSSSDRFNFVGECSDGGFMAVGDSGSYGAWFLKLDSNGNVEWEVGPGGGSGYYAVEADDGGYFVLTRGMSIVKIDSTGTPEWAKSYSGTSWVMKKTADGGFVIGAHTSSYGAGDEDIYILKFDSAGVLEWQKTYGGPNAEYTKAVDVTAAGGFIIGGMTRSYGAGDCDVWAFELDASGNILWERTYGTGCYERVRDIRYTDDGGCVIAAETPCLGFGNKDGWIFKLDANGEIADTCDFIGSSNATVIVVNETGSNYLPSYSFVNSNVQDSSVVVLDADVQSEELCYFSEGCPTIEEACEQLGTIVDEICPCEADWRNHGEYLGCVINTVREEREALFGECLSRRELMRLMGCVVSPRARSDCGIPFLFPRGGKMF